MENERKAPSPAWSGMQDRAIPEVWTLPLEPRRAIKMQSCCQGDSSSSLLFLHSILQAPPISSQSSSSSCQPGLLKKMKKLGEITDICAFSRREEGLSLLTAPTKSQIFCPKVRYLVPEKACAFSVVTRMAKSLEDS